MKKFKHTKETIKAMVSGRLSLQTTQRRLENMGIFNLTVDKILTQKFLDRFEKWPKEKQNVFINVIGGRHNIGHTFCWLHDAKKTVTA